jgi:hypothetical protein
MESESLTPSACPNCTSEADADSKFCKHCGFDLTKPDQSASQKTSSANRYVIVIALIAGIAVVALIVILSIWSRNPDQTAITSSSSTSSGISQATPPSKSELAHETVLNLVKGRMTKNVVAVMPSMALQIEPPTWQVFNQMANAKVIVCERSMLGDFASCKPGPNGKELRVRGKGMGAVLDLTIGRKVPSVNGISRADQTSALAQVSLTFEPSGGYDFFKRYQTAFKSNPMYGSGYDMDNEQHTVHLRLYDDGWRIEKID